MAHSFIFFLLFFSTAFAQRDQDYEVADLVKMQAGLFSPSGKKKLAVSLKIAKGWHIYWKNPGDAGIPPQFSFLKQGRPIPMEALEWPAPQKYLEGTVALASQGYSEQKGIRAFGYKGLTTFFFNFSPLAIKEFPGAKVILQGKWLICSDICIPGEDSLGLTFNHDLTQMQSSFQHDLLSQQDLSKAFAQLPAPMDFPPGLELSFSRSSSGKLSLHFSLKRDVLHLSHGQDDVLFPFPHERFDFRHEELFQDNEGNVFGRALLDWSGDYERPPVAFPSDGIFHPPLNLSFLFFNSQTEKRDVITVPLTHFILDKKETIEQFYQGLRPFSQEGTGPVEQRPLWALLLLAFLGGLILNFMPCVLPVISLKLFSLIKNKGGSRAMLLKHNGAYAAGVLLSFLGLALAVVLFQSSGESVGWGFQLQSPLFVVIMILALFIFALNLFGLFEWAIPGARRLASLPVKEGPWEDFLSGLLATILSTPCSAPFLGTALTFALTSTGEMVFLVFFFIGLGLSAPFLLIAIFPGSLVFLPRPGKWMDDLKKFLGLTLLLTIVWLYDVFLSLVSDHYYVLLVNLTLTSLFFSFYFYHRMGKNSWSKVFFFLAPVILFVTLLAPDLTSSRKTTLGPSSPYFDLGPGELDWKPWSEKAMEELRGELVFLDFTAQWCFTCKVNEKLVLETKGFKQLVKDKGVKLLLGDWTQRDPSIARFLKRHGHVGVPVYFIQKRDGRLISLGEMITLREIEQNL